MLGFNEFVQRNFEVGRRFFIQRVSGCESIDHAQSHSMFFISDANVLALHRLLWNHQERIGDYLSFSRDHKVMGRSLIGHLTLCLKFVLQKYNLYGLVLIENFPKPSYSFI